MKNSIWILGIVIGILVFGCVEEITIEEEKWREMQIKITYVGPQRKVVPTIGIYVKEFDIEKFKGYGTEGIDYGNDEIAVKSFNVTEGEMRRIVNAVFSLELIKEGKMPWEPSTSFMFYNATDVSVTEVILDENQTKILVEKISDSLNESISKATPLTIYS